MVDATDGAEASLQLTDDQLFAIGKAREIVVPTDESFIKGWVVLSINQWDVEQERLLLLTTKATYRVKYNFQTDEVERHERVALRDMRFIQKGYFKVNKFTFSGMINGDKIAKQYGIRIFAGEHKPDNPFAKDQYYRTFTALPDPTSPEGAGKALVLDILQAIHTARKNVARNDGFYISDYDISRSNYLGFVSVAMNAAKVGMFSKGKKADEAGAAAPSASSSKGKSGRVADDDEL